MRNVLLQASFVVATLSLVGCKDPPAPKVEPTAPAVEVDKAPKAVEPPQAASPTAVPPAAAATAADAVLPAAKDVIVSGAVFAFDWRASPDVFVKLSAKCKEDAKGDAGKEDLCMTTLDATASLEAIRFDQADGKWTWTSFGVKDGGGEEIFLKGPIAFVDGKPSEFKFKPAGDFVGKQAEEHGGGKFDAAKADAMVMTVETMDARSIYMASPKGKLVYHKK